ncbi:MAG: hypothetical protein ACR2GK_06695, partial [Gemmatimonadaceae bacterium]
MSRRKLIVAWSAIALLVVLLVLAAGIFSLTQTNYGQDQVRKYVQSWINGKAHGTFYVVRITGGLFTGVTIDSLEIRDERDSLFITTGPIKVKYDMRDIFDRRILLSHVDVTRPVVRLHEHLDGKWNYQRIFPSGPKRPPGTQRGFGDFIVIDSADVRDGKVAVGLKWSPADSLSGRKRDSVIAYALGSMTRVTKGNQWRSEVHRTDEGFSKIYRFTDLNAAVAYARIADPDTVGRLFRVARASVNSSDPPLQVRRVAIDIRHLGDSVWLQSPGFELAASRGSLPSGKLVWGGGIPMRYDIHITGDSVSLSDVAWVYPTLPATGGGKLDLHIHNVDHPRVVDYAIRNMDVRTTQSRLIGNMTYGVGGPVLVLKDVELRAAPLDFALIRVFNGEPLPLPWKGQLNGTVRARGGPVNRFRVDESRLTFNDGNVPGAVSRFTGRGMLDIFTPALTVFHGFDVAIETLDLRTLRYLSPAFLELQGTVSGTTRLDSLWLDVRFSNADILHHHGALPVSRITGRGRMTDNDTYMSYDMELEAAPVNMSTLAVSYPDIPLRGNFTGPVRIVGQPKELSVEASLTGAAGTITYAGTVDANLPTYGADGTGTFANINLRTLVENPDAPVTRVSGDYSIDFVGDSLVVGTGTLAGTMSGTVDRLAISSSRASVRLDNGIARIDTLIVQSDVAHATASGSVGLIEGMEGNLRFTLPVDSLADVKRY